MPNKKVNVTPQDIDKLASALDKFSQELSDPEKAMLSTMIAMSKDGIARLSRQKNIDKQLKGKALSQVPLEVTTPANLSVKDIVKESFNPKFRLPGGSSPLADSISVGGLCVTWTKDLKTIIDGKAIRTDRI